MLVGFSKKWVSYYEEKLQRPSLCHKLWLITKISNTQLPLVEWVLIYLLMHFLREVLSNKLASMRDTRE